MQRSINVSRRSLQRQIFKLTKPAAEFDWKNFPLPRTPNIFISRQRSNASSNPCPNQQQLMSTNSREHPKQNMQVYEYTQQIFGEKGSPTCANYALLLVAKDNAAYDEILVRMFQQNFHMNDSHMLVRSPQEAFESNQKVKGILSKSEYKLTKWITSDDEVNLLFPVTEVTEKCENFRI